MAAAENFQAVSSSHFTNDGVFKGFARFYMASGLINDFSAPGYFLDNKKAATFFNDGCDG